MPRALPAAEPPPKSLQKRVRKYWIVTGNACACCGFESAKYQEILYLNGNPVDTLPENLATVCIFCHQCFNLDQVAQMRSGVLVWLPEISQTDLHHIARAVYVARISQGPVADAARRALDVFMQRREECRTRLGTDDPFILSSVMRSPELGPRLP